jgi:hypothetical protein
MKQQFTTFICLAMVLINYPGALEGKTFSLISAAFCWVIAVACFFLNVRIRKTKERTEIIRQEIKELEGLKRILMD